MSTFIHWHEKGLLVDSKMWMTWLFWKAFHHHIAYSAFVEWIMKPVRLRYVIYIDYNRNNKTQISLHFTLSKQYKGFKDRRSIYFIPYSTSTWRDRFLFQWTEYHPCYRIYTFRAFHCTLEQVVILYLMKDYILQTYIRRKKIINL